MTIKSAFAWLRRQPGALDACLFLVVLAATAFTAGARLSALAGFVSPLAAVLFLRRRGAATGLPLGLCAFVVAHIVGWRDVLPLAAPAAIALAALIGAVSFIPFVIDRLLAPRLPGFAGALVLPCAWVVTAAIAHRAGIGTWGDVGYTQFGNRWLLQAAALSGLSTLLFGLGWAASATAACLLSGGRVRAPLAACLAAATCLCGFAVYRTSAPAPRVRVAGITVDNLPVFRNVWRPLSYGRPLDATAAAKARPQTLALQRRLLDASRQQARAGARIIVWSEGAAMTLGSDEAAFIAQGQKLAREEGVYLFMTMAVVTPGDALAVNKLSLIAPSGQVVAAYVKHHPAPGEASVAGANGVGVVDTPYGRLGWAICYDFDFSAFIRQAGRQGVDILIDPSWEGAGMAALHSRMAAFRAVENGAALFRVVNGGVSLAVDRTGRILSQLDQTRPAAEDTVMLADIPTRGGRTLYGRFGDWLAIVSAGLGGALLLGALRRKAGPP